MKKYFILTLGCQMNIADSQRIATKLEKLGYKSASEKEADLVILNACSIRQHAVDRIWGKIKKWQKEKKKIMVSGCVLKKDKKILVDKGIEFFDNSNLDKIKPKKFDKIAYITIMAGCDNFCSYCVVPYTRGREVSRKMEDIITELKQAINDGYKEIMLLGQNVNSYGKSQKSKVYKVNKEGPQSDNAEFIKLLNTVDKLPGEFTFNFMSSNPHDMSDDLINCFTHLKKWPRELHFAMQSGDDQILQRMNRKYTSKQYLSLCSQLKKKIPDIKISTDIIVGFPGETKLQFNNTVKICKKIGFSKAYISQFSPRAGTPAAKLDDDVSREEKKRRWLLLNELVNKKIN